MVCRVLVGCGLHALVLMAELHLHLHALECIALGIGSITPLDASCFHVPPPSSACSCFPAQCCAQVAALSKLVSLGSCSEAGMLGPSWLILLRTLSQLERLQVSRWRTDGSGVQLASAGWSAFW